MAEEVNSLRCDKHDFCVRLIVTEYGVAMGVHAAFEEEPSLNMLQTHVEKALETMLDYVEKRRESLDAG